MCSWDFLGNIRQCPTTIWSFTLAAAASDAGTTFGGNPSTPLPRTQGRHSIPWKLYFWLGGLANGGAQAGGAHEMGIRYSKRIVYI